MSEGFKGVPGVPDGWELVAIDNPAYGDWFINRDGLPEEWVQSHRCSRAMPIIRRIKQPDRYRPFANAEEFKPHRYRWWSWKDDRSNTFPPAAFGKSGHHSHSWEASFDQKVFDDGTPFGVKVDGN
jgi:hypothetical protein